MNGLFLQGGGAKGAFQAGAIYGLYDRGIKFNIISGTSIGSFNGYFIYKNSLDEMKKFYTKDDVLSQVRKLKVTNIIPNDHLMRMISSLQGKNDDVRSLFVNYVKVSGKDCKEIRKDISKLSEKEALECIANSSRLPYVIEGGKESIGFETVSRKFNSGELTPKFIKKLNMGCYDGMNLDGGVLNNDFMQPFTDNKVDKLYLIALHNGFKVPQYIYDKYEKDDIIVIERDKLFKANDSMNYEKGFLCGLFEEGYKMAYMIK